MRFRSIALGISFLFIPFILFSQEASPPAASPGALESPPVVEEPAAEADSAAESSSPEGLEQDEARQDDTAPEGEDGSTAAKREQGPWIIRASLFGTLDRAGLEGASSPILPAPGFAWALRLSTLGGKLPLYLEPSLDIRASYYAWSTVLMRPVPIEQENRSALVTSVLLACPVSLQLSLPGSLSLRVLAGPAFELPLVFVAEDLKGEDLEDARRQTGDIRSFVWSSGRFVNLLAGGELLYSIDGGMSLGLSTRLGIPLWRVWSQDSYTGLDRFYLAVGLSVYF